MSNTSYSSVILLLSLSVSSASRESNFGEEREGEEDEEGEDADAVARDLKQKNSIYCLLTRFALFIFHECIP